MTDVPENDKYLAQVSVIIPVYNVEKYLAKCLDSVINQTLENIEIICVNDGSTDSSPEILAQYATKNARVKIVNKLNGGLSSARNAGIKAAKGQYIGFVDSDDWIETETYETALAKILEDTDIDLVCWGANAIAESEGIEYLNAKNYHTINITGKQKLDDSVCLKTTVTVWNKMFKREIIQKNNVFFPEGLLFEDNAFFWNYVVDCRYAYYIDKYLYNYLQRKNSIIARSLSKQYHTPFRLLSFESICNFYGQKNILEKKKKLLEKIFMIMYNEEIRHSPDIKKIHEYATDIIKKYKLNVNIMEKTQPKVSVIVPIYNTEEYLPRCLNSLVGQTLYEIEIILIDDGSSDNSGKIANAYAQKDKRIKIITQKNSGASIARNDGIKSATGEYIGFVDADDYVDLNFYEKLYAARATADIVKAEIDITDENGNVSPLGPTFDSIKKNRANLNCAFSSCIYKYDFLIKNNLLFASDLKVGEDSLFLLCTVLLANKIEFADGAFYHYMRRAGSLDSYNLDEAKIKSNLLFINKSIDFINSIPLDIETYNIAFLYKMKLLLNLFGRTKSIEARGRIVTIAIKIFEKYKHPDCYTWYDLMIGEYITKKDEIGLMKHLLEEQKLFDTSFKLFGFLPIMRVRRKSNNTILRLFNFIPIMKIRHKKNETIYQLFGFLPIFTVKIS